MEINMLKLYETGYCTHPEKIVNPKGGLKPISFPATVALLKHPAHGYILFDTGYSTAFKEATKKFPYSIYAKLTPVYFSEEQSIKNQLLTDGIDPEQIKTIILSHFHGDHTAGLCDFPNANILSFKAAYEDIKNLSKFKALTKGCLLDLLPFDLSKRISFIDHTDPLTLNDRFGEFDTGYSVLGDDSIIAVDLTGHAIGQLGIFIRLESGKRVLLCADAVWLSESYQELIFPHPIANLLIANKQSYVENIHKLHHLSKTIPDIDILPTHCQKTWDLAKKGFVYE
ncbi:MBL fold metallo-hydrolase [Neobacillus sp.]|uniref:MBL fold metallo-hydrolase n=1 Tax=Neobacillus sp. TaxID=2675273 RepID=UPI0028A13B9C|nr:MBL fold metallo-hydrolase [Neobacillus sp.]